MTILRVVLCGVENDGWLRDGENLPTHKGEKKKGDACRVHLGCQADLVQPRGLCPTTIPTELEQMRNTINTKTYLAITRRVAVGMPQGVGASNAVRSSPQW